MGHWRHTEHLVWCFTCSAMVTLCSTASHTMDWGSRLAHSRNWDTSMADFPLLWGGRGRGCSELGPGCHGVQVPCHLGSLSPAQTGPGPSPRTHKAEAAADAGLHIAAPKRRHLPQLARDLDGLVEQDPEVPLVTQAPGVGHLAEEICGDTDTAESPADTGSRVWGTPGTPLPTPSTGSRVQSTPGTPLPTPSTELKYKEKPEL